MKLEIIFLARNAWQNLCSLKMPPTTAYRLLKYAKLVNAENDIIEQRRISLIREIAHAQDDEYAQLQPGTAEHGLFVLEFTKLLELDSDLQPLDMKVEDILAVIGGEKNNHISAQDLGFLEPFFVVPANNTVDKPE